jgi:hypothetical protein
MLLTSNKQKYPQVLSNGVMIVFGEHNTFGICANFADRMLLVTVYHKGKPYIEEYFSSNMAYRDRLDVNIKECMIIVRENGNILAQLGTLPQDHLWQPYMVWPGEQAYITENYVSIPPALRIVDDTGGLWTFGFELAHKDLSPEGEFAYNVIRDGIDMHIIASRIERHQGKIRVFTKQGWKRWLGREWS